MERQPPMTSHHLREAGKALFGQNLWRGGLSDLLIGKPFSEDARIRNWLSGEEIPDWVRPKLIAELRRRAELTSTVADRMVEA